jgi:hypothetical protein
MKYFIALLIFVFIVIVVLQVALGFPLISTIRENRRQKRWNERQKKKKENEKKIKLLNKKLKGKDEIEIYVALNRYNLPEDVEWKILLPKMIKDLLAIGWTTEMFLYTKYKYGQYEFHISTTNQNVMSNAISIFHKYIDKYEEMIE